MADEDDFSKWPPITWTVGGKTHLIPQITCKRTFGNRLAAHKRPYRKGARHDNTGPDPVSWELTLAAGRTVHEFDPRVPADYYPAGYTALLDSFDLEETGTLVTPFGERRCKAANGMASWGRADQGVDAVGITLTFIEDNEDDTDLGSFSLATARTAGPGQVDTFLGFAVQSGAGAGDFFDSLKEASRELQALANYPGDAIGEMVTRIQIITTSTVDVVDAYASAPQGAVERMSALLQDPLAGPALRKLEEFLDTACRAAEDEARRRGKARTVRTYDREVSIYDVAAELEQDCADLMNINSALPDMFEIPRGTPIQVFAP